LDILAIIPGEIWGIPSILFISGCVAAFVLLMLFIGCMVVILKVCCNKQAKHPMEEAQKVHEQEEEDVNSNRELHEAESQDVTN
jgi:signal transduction histidine kinase